MNVLTFDEASLVAWLASTSELARTTFAATTATRQLANYERYARLVGLADPFVPRRILVEVWSTIVDCPENLTDRYSELEAVMALIPEESDDWTIWHSLADDAASSLAYTVRSIRPTEIMDSCYAARRAFEAADVAAIQQLKQNSQNAQSESLIRSHPWVQRELIRQFRDRSRLHQSESTVELREIRKLAFEEHLLTDAEAVSLV